MDSNCIIQEEDNLPKNHTAARRIDFLDYDSNSLYDIIEDYCVHKNQPLVISNVHKAEGWDDQVFRLDELKKYRGDSVITIKTTTKNKEHKLKDYIAIIQDKYKLDLQDQSIHRDAQTETPQVDKTKLKKWKRDLNNFYGKDIICPTEYNEEMKKFLPEYLIPKGNCDLFSFLPSRFQAENLMCYLGQDDTGTPIHRDLCGTMGHNIMTMASPGGYAEWIIILNEDRDTLASYIKPSAKENRMINRKDRNTNSVAKSSFMESDRAWLSQETIVNSTLNVQAIIQRPGDLVIIPSRAYHQVRNVGVSIKIAWNRITPQSLHSAFEDQLPMYQIINRPEIYKCKAIVNFSIQKWNEYLSSATDWEEFCNLEVMKYKRHSFIYDVKMLADLYYNKVLLPEVLEPKDDEDVFVDEDPAEFCTVICDFCHSDVFYRYYHCKTCNDYDLCMGCYSIGRSCQHVDKMYMCRSPVKFSSLIQSYTSFIANVNRIYQGQGDNALIDQSEYLNNPSKINTPTLATICRRIERFRNEKGRKCNQLTCTHCTHKTKLAFEKKERVSVFYAFQRYPCPKARPKYSLKGIDLYVCDSCSSACDDCQPVHVPKLNIDYDLVYFTHPALDNRNWGAFFDSNINRSCFYPKVFYETFTEAENIDEYDAEPTEIEDSEIFKSKKTKEDDDSDFELDQNMEDPSDDDKITLARKRRSNRKRNTKKVEDTPTDCIIDHEEVDDILDDEEIVTKSKRKRASRSQMRMDVNETHTETVADDVIDVDSHIEVTPKSSKRNRKRKSKDVVETHTELLLDNEVLQDNNKTNHYIQEIPSDLSMDYTTLEYINNDKGDIPAVINNTEILTSIGASQHTIEI